MLIFHNCFRRQILERPTGILIGEMTKTEPKYGRKKSWTALEVIKDYFVEAEETYDIQFPLRSR